MPGTDYQTLSNPY